MLRWGCIPKSFPYPSPGHVEVGELVESDDIDIMDHFVYQVRESSELQAMKEQLLTKYAPVFKEDLGPTEIKRCGQSGTPG